MQPFFSHFIKCFLRSELLNEKVLIYIQRLNSLNSISLLETFYQKSATSHWPMAMSIKMWLLIWSNRVSDIQNRLVHSKMDQLAIQKFEPLGCVYLCMEYGCMNLSNLFFFPPSENAPEREVERVKIAYFNANRFKKYSII